MPQGQETYAYNRGFPTDNFVYDPKDDVFVCPGDRILKGKGKSYRWHWTVYKAEKKIFKGCKLRNQCIGGKAGRSVIRYDRQEALDFALAHLKTEKAKTAIKERKIYAETMPSISVWIKRLRIFAEAKNSHGLRRTICRDWIKCECIKRYAFKLF